MATIMRVTEGGRLSWDYPTDAVIDTSDWTTEMLMAMVEDELSTRWTLARHFDAGRHWFDKETSKCIGCKMYRSSLGSTLKEEFDGTAVETASA